jgi:type I restriction enzyme S subunit
MSEWQEYLLEDVIEKFIDYRGKTPDKKDAGIPLITAKIVKAGKILPANEFIAVEDYDSWMTRGLPEINDIVLTTEAPLGELALIKNTNVALAQRIITLRGKKDLVFNPFLKYYFQSELGQHELQSRASGTTVFGIKASVLKKVPVNLPEISEQKAIANILSSLDDKIDLLHRQNKTLEEMAETLFRQWFIEEAGEDWEDVPLVDFFDFLEGPGIRNWQYTESGTPFINIRLISNGNIDISKASFISDEEANGKYNHFHLQAGDMIVSTSGTLGKNAIVRDYHLPLMLNTSVIRFKPKDGKSHSFMYQYLNSKLFQEHLESAASGSVQANFGPVHLKQMTINIPAQDILSKYLKQADSFYEKIRINQKQIKTLEKLRDNLLPKLMSGEVRVKL